MKKSTKQSGGNAWRFQGNELKYVKEVLDSGFGSSTIGTMNQRFEAAFAKRFGSKYAVASNSGTSTLHQALMAFGVGPGDEVIVPALTVVMCGYAVMYAGAKPVFADVLPDTFLIDPKDIEKKITKNTKAIMPVHLYGQVCDMEAIMKVAKKHNLYVVEDCAQCFLGTDAKGRYGGTIGHAGSFSLENSKHLSTGDGGILLTDNEKIAERMRKFGCMGFKSIGAVSGQVKKNKDVFQDPKYLRHTAFGYNYRLTAIAGAVGLAQVEKIDYLVKKRQAIAAKYRKALVDSKILIPQHIPKGHVNSCYTFAARFEGEKMGVSWYDFRAKFMEFGGDGIYSAWALVYNEPVMKLINDKGAFFEDLPNQAKHLKGYLPKNPNCPVAEMLQPKLMQFTANQGIEGDMNKQMNALIKTVKFFEAKK